MHNKMKAAVGSVGVLQQGERLRTLRGNNPPLCLLSFAIVRLLPA